MASRKESRIEILRDIRSNKDVLFGAFSDTLTKEEKNNKWKVIHGKAQALNVVPANKDFKYTRDTFWQNLRKNAMKKIDNKKKTGSEGGPDCKFTETDNIVFDIIGKDSPAVMGLPCPETWDNENGTGDRQMTGEEEIQMHNSAETANEPASSSKVCIQPKRRSNTTEEEDLKIKKLKLAIEIMEKESHMKSLEILKLERELGVTRSKFTEEFSNAENEESFFYCNISENN